MRLGGCFFWVFAGRTGHFVGFVKLRLKLRNALRFNCCNHPKIWIRWLTYMCPKYADGVANSIDPDQTAPLIWVYTVCLVLSVQILLRTITVPLKLSLPFEPWHDKTNKMSVCPGKTQISLGIRVGFNLPLFPRWTKLSRDMTKPTKWVCAQRRLISAWASAQSDQSLRCALNG